MEKFTELQNFNQFGIVIFAKITTRLHKVGTMCTPYFAAGYMKEALMWRLIWPTKRKISQILNIVQQPRAWSGISERLNNIDFELSVTYSSL